MTPGRETQAAAPAGEGDSSAPASGPLPGLDIPTGGGGGHVSPATERWNEIRGDVQAGLSAAASLAFNDRASRSDTDRRSRADDGDRPCRTVTDWLNEAAARSGGGPVGAGLAGPAPDVGGSDQIHPSFEQFAQEADQLLQNLQAGGQTTDNALRVLQDQQEKNRVYRDLGEEKAGDPTDAHHTSRAVAHERSKNRAEEAARHASLEPFGGRNPIRRAWQGHVTARFNERSLAEVRDGAVRGVSPRDRRDRAGRILGGRGRESPPEREPDLNQPSAAPTEDFLPGAGGRRLTDGVTRRPRKETPSGQVLRAWHGSEWLEHYRARIATRYRMMGARRPPIELH